jgi:hypothetical protein
MTLDEALNTTCEKSVVDFKREYNPKNKENVLGLLKDLVAMANSGGGFILVGLSDDGTPYAGETHIEDFIREDVSVIQNNLEKYLGIKGLIKLEKHTCSKFDSKIIAIEVHEVPYPAVIEKEGAYEDSNKRTKVLFNKGICYFRHGAKSEPASFYDLQQFIDKKIEYTVKTVPKTLAKLSFMVTQRTQSNRLFTFSVLNTGGTAHRAYIEVSTSNEHEYKRVSSLPVFNTNTSLEFTLNFNDPSWNNTEVPPPGSIQVRLVGYDANGKEDKCFKSMIFSRDGYKTEMD